MAVTPKDAAAIILLKDPNDLKVFWVKRSPKLQFMGGYHAFPGGQLDKEDSLCGVAGCEGEPVNARPCQAIDWLAQPVAPVIDTVIATVIVWPFLKGPAFVK